MSSLDVYREKINYYLAVPGGVFVILASFFLALAFIMLTVYGFNQDPRTLTGAVGLVSCSAWLNAEAVHQRLNEGEFN